MNRLPKSGRSIQKRTIGINHGSIKHPPAYLIREIGTQTTPGVRKEFRFQAIQVQFGRILCVFPHASCVLCHPKYSA